MCLRNKLVHEKFTEVYNNSTEFCKLLDAWF